MNNRGFTLIELLAIILIIGIISSVGTYAITSYVKATRTKTNSILWDNIKVAGQSYIDECTNGLSSLTCGISEVSTGSTIKYSRTITLKKLADNGFFNTVGNNNSSTNVILDGHNNNINSCEITIIKEVDTSTYIVSYNVSLKNDDSCKDLKNKHESFK